jgi:hypothetical protein
MTTLTQRKKGWWKVWVLLAILVTVIITGVILFFVGYDYISWIGVSLVGAKNWASSGWVSAAIESTTWVLIGMGIIYLYYYQRGQKTTVAPGQTGTGYAPTPAYPSQSQKDTETVIS